MSYQKALLLIRDAQVSEVQELDLSALGLKRLPPEIAKLQHLQILNLSDNELDQLPNEFGQLHNLQILNLSRNELDQLPNEFGQLHNLQILNLSYNKLDRLPNEFGQLYNLQTLYLSYNKLDRLPNEFGQLHKLQTLYLNRNELDRLPSNFGSLHNLQSLYLNDNRIAQLPNGFGQLYNLQRLALSHNQLNQLPRSFVQLERLAILQLHGNEKLGIADELLGRPMSTWSNYQTVPPKEIIAAYFSLQGGSRPLNEVKLLLVGYGEVGKTSLVGQLLNAKACNPTEAKTERIEITDWTLNVSGDEILAHVWDFGGQEIMHATHQFFLTQRSVYLLVLSGRQGHEDADADYWLHLIQSFGEDSPVIIILNKYHAHAFDLNRGDLLQRFPNIRAFVKTDCVDGFGIDTLTEEIGKAIDSIDDVRADFPASWFKVKDALQAMDDNYITFSDFRKICERYEETEPKQQNSLAGFLHRLGIALNFQDDARLNSTHVLKPDWATEGIYAILNAPEVANSGGVVTAGDLRIILDGTTYPATLHDFLLELMRKFELSFRVPDSDSYLVPELLSKQQPEVAGTFDPVTCLNFIYQYPSLPEGLLPRFIVRTHSLSQDGERWRTGVILRFEGARALVKTDRHNYRVTINIDGATRDARRRLLGIIRSDFERIHTPFSFTAKELVPIPKHPQAPPMIYKELLLLQKKGKKTIDRIVDDALIEVNIAELLDGVDMRRARGGTHSGLGVFYSYSHKDETLRDELETHLKLLQRQGLISEWHDRKILPGGDWSGEIDRHLETADLILLLVSADFIASNYCYDIEMDRALERHAAGKARAIPIIVRPCQWQRSRLRTLQAIPRDNKPITTWANRDEAWNTVANELATLIDARSKATDRGK